MRLTFQKLQPAVYCIGCKKKEGGICKGCIASEVIVKQGRNLAVAQYTNAPENIMCSFLVYVTNPLAEG